MARVNLLLKAIVAKSGLTRRILRLALRAIGFADVRYGVRLSAVGFCPLLQVALHMRCARLGVAAIMRKQEAPLLGTQICLHSPLNENQHVNYIFYADFRK